MSRSRKHPRIAYIMVPESMAPVDMTANIYMGKDGKIGIELKASGGEYAVNKSSFGSKTRRINLPISMVALIPYGIHDIEFERVGKLLVFDPENYTEV
jgi:hypothetical protein